MSSFAGLAFDWLFKNPKRAYMEGCVVLSGQIIVYTKADLDGLFSAYRPVTRRVAGDPQAGGTVYVDHWGPDPSAQLVMGELDGVPPTSGGISYTAILSAITRTEAMPGGVHFVDVEFTLLDAGTSLGPLP